MHEEYIPRALLQGEEDVWDKLNKFSLGERSDMRKGKKILRKIKTTSSNKKSKSVISSSDISTGYIVYTKATQEGIKFIFLLFFYGLRAMT
jgi:hypothetical protein